MKLLGRLGHLNTMTFSAIQMMTFTLIPFIAERGSLSLSSVVLSFSLGSFLFLWSSPFWAAKSDPWGRMKVLTIGMLGLFISTGLLTWIIMKPGSIIFNEILLWSGRLLYGATAAALVPVAQALQIDLHPDQSALKSMLSNSMSLNIGRALGPLYLLLGGGTHMVLVLQSTTLWAFFVVGLNIIASRKDIVKIKKSERLAWNEWTLSLRRISDIFSLALLFTSFIGILNFSLASVLKKTFALSGADASVLMSQVLLVSAVLAVLTQALGKILFKNPWQGALILGAVSLLCGTLFLGHMSSWNHLWLAMGFLSIGISLIPPCYLALMVSRGSELHLGRRAGLAAAANTLGYTLGGALAAATFKLDVFGVESILTALVIVMSFNIALLYKNRRREVAYA